jgi:IS5 family transposase
MENRNGLCTDVRLSRATGRAEPEAALEMVRRSTEPLKRRVTLGADKGYDRGEFTIALVEEGVVPHIAQKEGLRPLIDRRTTGRRGYQISQRKRKLVEEIFGWGKTIGGIAKTRFRGAARVAAQFVMTMSVYNLVRMARLELQVT